MQGLHQKTTTAHRAGPKFHRGRGKGWGDRPRYPAYPVKNVYGPHPYPYRPALRALRGNLGPHILPMVGLGRWIPTGLIVGPPPPRPIPTPSVTRITAPGVAGGVTGLAVIVGL